MREHAQQSLLWHRRIRARFPWHSGPSSLGTSPCKPGAQGLLSS